MVRKKFLTVSKIEQIRRITEPHSSKDCGGCLGFYQDGKLIIHRTMKASEMY